MIKVGCNWGDCTCEVHGSLSVLCADTSAILRAIYDGIKKQDEGAAEEYKKQMSENLIKLAFRSEEAMKEMEENGKLDRISDALGLLKILLEAVGSDSDNDESEDDSDD